MHKEEKQVFRYSLAIKGLFGRNRSVKSKSFDLVVDSESKLSADEIRPKAEAKLKELKPKGQHYIRVSENKEKLTVYPDGTEMRSFMMFHDQSVLINELRG